MQNEELGTVGCCRGWLPMNRIANSQVYRGASIATMACITGGVCANAQCRKGLSSILPITQSMICN